MADLLLGQKRALFSWLLPDLFNEIKREGYIYRLDEGYVGRSIDKPWEDTPHLRTGGHLKGIAQDVLLFQCRHRPAHLDWSCPAAEYLTDSAVYQPFGTFWKLLHPLCRWGGDFPDPDGDHFSLEDGGVA